MLTVKDPQTEIGYSEAVSEQSGDPESNSAYYDNLSTSHTKNGVNPTAGSNTQPLNASVTPNKSHIPI